MGSWVLFVFTLPAAVLSWLLGLASIIFGLAYQPRFEQGAVLTLQWRKRVDDLWPYSTTLCRTVWYGAARRTAHPLDEPVERHETVHIRQWEDCMVLSFLVGLGTAVGLWALGGPVSQSVGLWLTLWVSGALWMVPNFLTAVMRFGFKGIYRDSEHERSAYAQTTARAFRPGESWWEHRERARDE